MSSASQGGKPPKGSQEYELEVTRVFSELLIRHRKACLEKDSSWKEIERVVSKNPHLKPMKEAFFSVWKNAPGEKRLREEAASSNSSAIASAPGPSRGEIPISQGAMPPPAPRASSAPPSGSPQGKLPAGRGGPPRPGGRGQAY